MMTPSRTRLMSAIGGLLVIAALACDKNKPTQPGLPLAAIQTIWPNEDGRAWTYSLIVEEWPDDTTTGIFPNAADVPPAPTLVSLRARFPTLAKGAPVTADTGSLTLRFAGTVTTGSGVTAQNLQETIGPPAPGLRVSASRFALGPGGSRDRFLAQLWQARPNLRTRIGARYGTAGVPTGGLRFLPGGAWKKTPSAILRYGDGDTFPTWEYLRADPVAGAEFSRQLVPSLAPDVILRGRVFGRKSVVTPFGTFSDAIEVFYLLDFGVSEITDEQGSLIGSARSISCGTVFYVNSLGPVESSERAHLRVARNGVFSKGAGGAVRA